MIEEEREIFIDVSSIICVHAGCYERTGYIRSEWVFRIDLAVREFQNKEIRLVQRDVWGMSHKAIIAVEIKSHMTYYLVNIIREEAVNGS